jgi:hypothetical protein
MGNGADSPTVTVIEPEEKLPPLRIILETRTRKLMPSISLLPLG